MAVYDVTDFGASPAATPSENVTGIQDAIEAAAADVPSSVLVPAGVYETDSRIWMRDFVTIGGEGVTSEIKNVFDGANNNNKLVFILGNYTGSAFDPSGLPFFSLLSASKGANQLEFVNQADADKFSAGDIMIIRSDESSGNDRPDFQEINKITDKTGKVVTLKFPLHKDLGGADPKAALSGDPNNTAPALGEPAKFVDQATIRDLKLTSVNGNWMALGGAFECLIEDVEIEANGLVDLNAFTRSTMRRVTSSYWRRFLHMAIYSHHSLFEDITGTWLNQANLDTSSIVPAEGAHDLTFRNITLNSAHPGSTGDALYRALVQIGKSENIVVDNFQATLTGGLPEFAIVEYRTTSGDGAVDNVTQNSAFTYPGTATEISDTSGNTNKAVNTTFNGTLEELNASSGSGTPSAQAATVDGAGDVDTGTTGSGTPQAQSAVVSGEGEVSGEQEAITFFWPKQEYDFIVTDDNSKTVAHYIPGLVYQVNDARPLHDRLRTALEGGSFGDDVYDGWVNDGKCSLTSPVSEAHTASGSAAAQNASASGAGSIDAQSESHTASGAVSAQNVTVSGSGSAFTPSEGITPESGFTVTRVGGGDIVDNVEYEITDISGQNRFGTKPTGSKPYRVLDAEYGDTSFSSLGRVTTSMAKQNWTWQQSVVPQNGIAALEYRYQGETSGQVWSDTDFEFSSPVKVSTSTRIRSNWDPSQHIGSDDGEFNRKGFKVYRLDDNVTPKHFSSPLWGQTSASDGSPRIGGEPASDFTVGGTNGNDIIGLDVWKNSWKTLEHFGTVGINPTIIIVNVEGKQIEISDPDHRADDYTGIARYIGHHEQNSWAQTSFRDWYGLIYTDNSWCRVYITDSSEWSTTTWHERSVCIPTLWQSDKIRFIARKRALNSLAGNFLHVQTNDGTGIKIATFD